MRTQPMNASGRVFPHNRGCNNVMAGQETRFPGSGSHLSPFYAASLLYEMIPAFIQVGLEDEGDGDGGPPAFAVSMW